MKTNNSSEVFDRMMKLIGFHRLPGPLALLVKDQMVAAIKKHDPESFFDERRIAMLYGRLLSEEALNMYQALQAMADHIESIGTPNDNPIHQGERSWQEKEKTWMKKN